MSDSGSSSRDSSLARFSGADGSSSLRTHLGPDPFMVGDEPTVISQNPPRLFPQVRPGANPLEIGRILEGERLGHFDLEEFIGGGGMGAVFRALDTMLNRIVAVKVLSSDQATDEETQRRFRNEAQSAARLDHENIARVYYVGEDRGVHYIVFEYIEGINIRDLVARDGSLPLADAISYTWQIAKALTHASQRDVVHRDIKPSNVLITPGGRAKLVDMGLARLHQVEHTENDLTASGVTLGTFDYISPEQARDPRMADVRSDLYSLGCTLYYMLTGRPPFPEGTVLQKLLRHQGDAPPDPRETRPDVPEPLATITMRLLAKSPADRFQNPDELIAALGVVCEELGLPVSELLRPAPLLVEPHRPVAHSYRRRQLARHLPWALPLALLLLATFVIDRLWSVASEEVSFDDFRPHAVLRQTALPATGGQPAAVDDAANAESAGTRKRPAPRANEGLRNGAGLNQPGNLLPEASNAAETAADAPLPTELATSSTSGSNSSARVEAPASRGGASESEATSPAKIDATMPPAELGPQAELGTGPLAESGTGKSPDNAAAKALESSKPPPMQVAVASVANKTDPKISTTGEAVGLNGGGSPLVRGPMDPLVVDPAGVVGAYTTLEAACAAATSGDVIELRFDGLLTARPVKFNNVTLTIRAARGKQPRVLFRPTPADKTPTLYPRSMITMTGGDLTLVGMQLELELSRDLPSENWALIESRGAQSLNFEQCLLTIRNATESGGGYHQNVQFIDVRPAPSDGMMRDMPLAVGGSPMKIRPLEARMLNCVARGEAVLLRSASMESFDFSWQNGLAVLSETLFELNARQTGMRDASRAQIDLQHVTAVARRGLLLATNSDDAPYPVEAELTCRDSIFMIGAGAALIEQRGVHPAAALQEMIVWTGERNFFEGFSTFWKIRVLGLGEQDQLPPLAFEGWRSYWQQRPEGYAIQSHLGAVIWKHLPPATLAPHAQWQANYLLGEGVAGNPARGAAKNGQDVGFQAGLLPVPSSDAPPGPTP